MRKDTKQLYLACIWCGKDIPKEKKYAKYCSQKCRDEALGRFIKWPKK